MDAADASSNASDFRFTPSPTRRKANYAAFVAKTRAQDPAGAAQLEQLFAQIDVVAATEAPLAKLGLSSRNVADAYAAWWVTAWLGAQGRSDDPSRGQMQAVKRQAEAAFAATPQVATMTDAQKQEFAEALLVQAALLTDAVEQSQANPAQLEQVKAAIRQGAQASGMDLDAMILTEEGFKPGGKTGDAAPPPAPGIETPQLAAAPNASTKSAPTEAAPGNDDLPLYIAGGAAILAAFALGKSMARRG